MGDFTMTDDVKKTIKEFILSEFLPGEDPAELTDTTPLITGGVLDSIATLKLVLFIEERFAITLEAHDVDPEHLDTIEKVAWLILSRNAKASYEKA
jgi:acyl carrier protein